MLKFFFNRLHTTWAHPDPPVSVKFFQTVFLPLSLLNGFIQQARIFLYHLGIFKKIKLSAKVICVGNLSMGGTGKTPTVIRIAEILLEAGKKPSILSRGYKGKREKGSSLVVSDGENILADQDAAGDEPYLLAKKLKEVPVVVGKDRIVSGKEALSRFSSNVLLLDDGFQYLRLVRDLNLCLIDCDGKNLFQDHLFPSGQLREPVGQLKRADAFLLTRWEDSPLNEELLQEIKSRFGKKVFRSRHVPYSWMDAGTEKEIDLAEAKGKKILAFCGIAKPQSFEKSLKTFGFNPISLLSFPDHYEYAENDLQAIKKQGESSGADLVATTEKDWVKLPNRFDFSVPLWILKIKVEIMEEEQFRSFFSNI